MAGLRVVILGAFASCALAFHVSHFPQQRSSRASTKLGLCKTGMHAADDSMLQAMSRRTAALMLLSMPLAAFAAKDKKQAPPEESKKYATISLDEFYAALEDQEVGTVEFDGPKFEKCYVTMLDGKQFLVGEGYPVESSVSSVGPQSVVGKIKNEIKAGNPVKWSWKGAAAFKKFAPKQEVAVDKAEGNLSAEVAKREKKGERKEGGGLFGFLPSPPKKLQQANVAPGDSEDEDE